jgi:hypothetical protein
MHMTNYLTTRLGEKFTNAEFKAIPRNSDGDIIDLFDAYCFLTNAQREKLTADDQSRCEGYDEEMRYLAAEALEEFGF